MPDFVDINNPNCSRFPTEEEPEQSPPPASDEGGEQEETGAATAELRLLSACFEPHPIHGYTVKKYCRVSGTAEFLARTSRTRCSLRLFSIFQGEQDSQVREEDLQIDPQKYGSCTIDTESGTFCFTDVPLYIPQGYPDREDFTTPIRYKAVISAERAEQPLECFVDLPSAATALPDLRKGMFDDHAVDKYKEDTPRKYLAGADGHVAGEPIFELQLVMELFRYLPSKTANGVFGPKTEAAIKKFQDDALKLLRVDKPSGKLVQATSVRYQGVVDGVVEQRVRDEIAVWKQENFLRPLPCLYFDDFDTEAIKLGVKSAPPTTSQRSGASTQSDYHDMGLPVLELQKLLNQIGAYAGKLDGWFGDKMKAAVELFQMHAEKGEFTDAAGNPVTVPEQKRLSKEPKGSATVTVQEAVQKVADKNLKVVPIKTVQDSQTNSNGQFNIDKAIAYLIKNSVQPYGIGKCAKHVRLGILAGGINIAPNPVSAKEYGPYLEKHGFAQITKIAYVPAKGDIIVMQSFAGASNQHGHIQMYGGNGWVSDFSQPDLYPSSRYKQNNAEYKVYRWVNK